MSSIVDVTPVPSAELVDTVGRLLPDDGPFRWSALSGGVSSDIWRIEGPRCIYCVKRALPRLKVASEWYAPVERNREEVRWLRFAATVVPGQVPEVIAADEDAGVAILSWFEPRQWRNWKAMLFQGQIRAGLGSDVGHLLAVLHRASTKRHDIAAAFENLDLFEALRLEPYFGTAGRRNPEVASILGEIRSELHSHRTALVHGDVSPKNILIHQSRPPVLLDAECACWGDPAFDVAFLVSHLLLKAAQISRYRQWFYKTIQRFLDAYERSAPEVVDPRTRRLVPALLLARVDGKSPVEYLDAEIRLRVRDTALEALERPYSTTAEFLAAFRLAYYR